MAYTQLGEGKTRADQLTDVDGFFKAHAQRVHGESSAADALYVRQTCSEFLASSHSKEETAEASSNSPFQEEVILDTNLTKRTRIKQKRDKRRPLAVIATPPSASSPPLDSSVRGYKCAIDSCYKIFMVSSIQGPSVAISRLKNHFKNKHQSLGSDKFAFEAIYSPVSSPATHRDASPTAAGRVVAAAATPPRKSPGRASATVAKSPAVVSGSPGDHGLPRNRLRTDLMTIGQFYSVLWIRIRIGSVFRTFLDPDPYSKYASGTTHVNCKCIKWRQKVLDLRNTVK